MSRRFYLWLAAGGFVLVSALYVGQQWIPDPGAGAGEAETAVRDTAAVEASGEAGADTTAIRSRPAPGPAQGDDPLVLVALILGGTGLVAAAAAWWQASGSAPAEPAGSRPSDAELEAADRLAGTLAPALTAASRFCQLLQMAAQLGDEAPEGFAEQVAAARETTAERRQQLEAELMRDAALLPTSVLETAHDAHRTIESILADETLAQMQGAALATQLQVAYYTFAGTVRQWAGLPGLDVERLLGGEGDAEEPAPPSAAAASPPSPKPPATAPAGEPETPSEAERSEAERSEAEGDAPEHEAEPDVEPDPEPEAGREEEREGEDEDVERR